MRLTATICFVLLLAPTSSSLAQDLGEFELWPEAPTHEVAVEAPAVRAETKAPAARVAKPPATPPAAYLIRFGVGPSYLAPLRLSDKAHGNMVFPEFAVAVSPFGLPAELGLDIAIGRDQTLLLRTDLRAYAFRHWLFSLYMEASCAVYVGRQSTEVGGGVGLGMIFGLMENLSVELRASGDLFSMPADLVAELVGAGGNGDTGRQWIIFPAVTARVMARF
jgi:hypothetical protein